MCWGEGKAHLLGSGIQSTYVSPKIDIFERKVEIEVFPGWREINSRYKVDYDA